MTDFTYDDDLHEYRLNGVRIESITNLLRPLYEARLSHIPDQNVVERARERGSKAHKDIERMFLGECDQYESNYTMAWQKFCDSTGFVATHCEMPTYHPSYPFGCKIDMLGKLGDGTQVLIDVKTGQSQKWHTLQTAGQAMALSYHGFCDRSVLRGNVLLYEKDGEWTYKFDEHSDAIDFKFLHSFLGYEQLKGRYM